MKYTLEILTKDIQDIEKLVANLQNSPGGSLLELDLALAKLRNLYDMLTVIRSDMEQALKAAGEGQVGMAAETSPAVKEQPPVEAGAPPADRPAPTVVVDSPSENGSIAKEVPAETEVSGAEEEPAVEEKPAVEQKPAQTRTKTPEIIAEKFSAESSINENLAGARDPKLDSKLIGHPIDSISRNIGINDRFLIIRELFNGDSEGFKKLLEALDNAGNLKAARELLDRQFPGSAEHEGISILANLVKRRYNNH